MMAAAQVAIAEVSKVFQLFLSCFYTLQSHQVAHGKCPDVPMQVSAKLKRKKKLKKPETTGEEPAENGAASTAAAAKQDASQVRPLPCVTILGGMLKLLVE